MSTEYLQVLAEVIVRESDVNHWKQQGLLHRLNCVAVDYRCDC